jgi:hypothetical protein
MAVALLGVEVAAVRGGGGVGFVVHGGSSIYSMS